MTRTPLLLVPLMVAAIAGCTVYQEFRTHKGASAGASGTGGTGGATSGPGGATTSSTGNVGGASTSGTGGTGGTGGTSTCTPGETAACYSGPPATENVGLCKAGTKTCADDGSGFGPCMGEVLPKTEDCATPQDEDCDGLAPACSGGLQWARRFGNASSQTMRSIAADASGNVLVTGNFFGSVDFGGGPLMGAGLYDAVVVKLDAGGAHLWSKSFGDAGDQLGQGVAVDPAGNVLVTGDFGGSIDFGGGPLTSMGGYDIFVAKLDASGAHLWSKRFGDASHQIGQSIATDSAGNVLITGYFYGSVDFGGGLLISAPGGPDLFVAKFDASGAHVWSKRFGDANSQSGTSIATDSAGNVFVTGNFYGSVDFGGGPLTSAGGPDLFVAKFDASGAHVWSKRFGDASDQLGEGIATDSAGNVLVTGSFYGSMDLGGGPLFSAGLADLFVAKLDAGGAHLWSKRFGDASNQDGKGIATDGAGNVLVTGYLDGQTDFGGGPLASAGGQDVLLLKLDPSGAHVWSKRFGDTNDQLGQGIAADVGGNVLVVGDLAGAMDLGGVILTSAGGTDGWIAKFSP